jgi:hypothetical protein
MVSQLRKKVTSRSLNQPKKKLQLNQLRTLLKKFLSKSLRKKRKLKSQASKYPTIQTTLSTLSLESYLKSNPRKKKPVSQSTRKNQSLQNSLPLRNTSPNKSNKRRSLKDQWSNLSRRRRKRKMTSTPTFLSRPIKLRLKGSNKYLPFMSTN